eukprot:4510464-Prymnesium_polylepis.1
MLAQSNNTLTQTGSPRHTVTDQVRRPGTARGARSANTPRVAPNPSDTNGTALGALGLHQSAHVDASHIGTSATTRSRRLRALPDSAPSPVDP